MYNKQDIYEPYEEFPFDQLYEKEEGIEQKKHELEELILNKILEFLHPHRASPKSSLCRLFALLLICGRITGGKTNPTQVDIANKLGVSKSVMSAHCNAAKDFFGIKTSVCPRSEEAREKFRAICKSRAGELAEARNRSREKKKQEAQDKTNPTGSNKK